MEVLTISIIEKIIAAKSIEDAWTPFCSLARSAGFDSMAYGTNRLRHTGTFGERAHSFFMSNMPETFASVYWDNDEYRNDFAAEWAFLNNGAISLKDAALPYHNGTANAYQIATHKKIRTLGATSGYAIGFNHPNATSAAAVGLVNFGKSHDATDAIWARRGAEIETTARILHLKILTMPLPVLTKRLTDRQRDVLRWVAQGKTTAEVATILGLSQATIEKHLRQARDNLGASNTTQAVLNAQLYTDVFDEQK